MKNLKLLLLSILMTCGGSGLFAQNTIDCRISEKEILTPLPAKTPRINGPKIYGARPARDFLYRIPCQGERPIHFTIGKLPETLTIDSKGIITGMSPQKKGTYRMIITATNKYGTTTRDFKIVVGDKLCLTPPTGWNSWGGQMINVSDKDMRKAADVFDHRGLADVGFQYLGIDDCWMRLNQDMFDNQSEGNKKKHRSYDYEGTGTIGVVRDNKGSILPNGKFPDMKAMTDYFHALGLKVGIYSGPGAKTCQRWEASYGHERADADQYAKWGFDLLKYDMCSGSEVYQIMKDRISGFSQKDFWRPMAEYIQVQDRDMVFNLCQYGKEDPWTWAPSLNIQSWRTGGDLNHHVDQYFKEALRIAIDLRAYSKPGQWNDPDFMYIHRIKNVGNMNAPSVEIALNTNQRYQYVTLWSIICAPFFFSTDITAIDDFTIGLLSNPEVMNINQDERGHVAEVFRNENNEVVMVKNLDNGNKVLAIFNRDHQNEKIIKLNWNEINLWGVQEVFDVWREKDLGQIKEAIQVRLSPDGVALFTLKKP